MQTNTELEPPSKGALLEELGVDAIEGEEDEVKDREEEEDVCVGVGAGELGAGCVDEGGAVDEDVEEDAEEVECVWAGVGVGEAALDPARASMSKLNL